MSYLLTKIADFNNLYWAWEKAKNIYKPGDIWFNELEVAAFEATLSEQLHSINKDILDGNYKLQLISPVAYPKSRNEKGPRTRQTFWISVRDQVTWLAVVNILGQFLDSKMPFWSYGNRLYISTFYQKDHLTNSSELKFGYYRNTTKYTYRKWAQSWPLYRKHINLTARFLTKTEKEVRSDLETTEQKIFENNDRLNNTHPLKANYLNQGYWKGRKKEGLFWAGVDLEKFYPSIKKSAVLNNFRDYLPTQFYDEDATNLIDSLFAFRIDFSKWDLTDLETVGLLPKIEEYDHLPTGLFVAGFLANVAMLKVDDIIQSKLIKNKNIAHFRYVDDHVILATNFHELTTWIDDYKEILIDSDTGCVFNLEKTEPGELANYLSCIENNDTENQFELRGLAEKSTSLDPDFPNPLLTQTLNKVSKIAGTEFNLLSPDEEKSLIADIEHLLVTEFPDHELRKDTRVSFSARMLSTLVPQMSFDSSLYYQLYRSVCEKELIIKKYEINYENEARTKEKVEIENEIKQFKEELLSYQNKLKIETGRLKNEEVRLINRTIKFLAKAVQENHDKIRLWSRLLEFFQKSGTSNPEVILTEIKKLIEKEETNTLSLTFIHSLMLQVFSTLLLDVIRLLDSKSYSRKKKTRAFNYVKGMLESGIFDYFNSTIGVESKSYEIDSLKMFQFSAGSAIYILNTYLIEDEKDKLNIDIINKYQLINWSNPNEFVERTSHPFGVWAWWLLTKLTSPNLQTQPYLWDKIIDYLNLKKPADLNVLLLYPQFVTIPTLLRLNQIENSRLQENEGLLFDLLKNTNEEISGHYNLLHRVKSKSKPLNNYVTLYDWINWTKYSHNKTVNNDNETLMFDPRLGEWSALEIIRQTAIAIKTRLEKAPFSKGYKPIDYFKYIHPNNFKVPRLWVAEFETLTWEELTILFTNKKVEFRAIDDLISDNRFIPYFGRDSDNENQAILNGLGSLLISLLSKNTNLPSKWNPLGMQQAYLQLANIKLKDIAVSTYTRDIISGCFSNRNIETQFNLRLNIDVGFTFDDDTLNDPPIFIDIYDFLNYVELSLKKLKNQQLSVSGHQPRQLTPVSLLQLKRNDYQSLMDEEDIE